MHGSILPWAHISLVGRPGERSSLEAGHVAFGPHYANMSTNISKGCSFGIGRNKFGVHLEQHNLYNSHVK